MFVVLNAGEYKFDGDKKATRVVKLRNPWGSTDKGEAYWEGSDLYKKMEAHLKSEKKNIVKEGGTFFLTWENLRKQINAIEVVYG